MRIYSLKNKHDFCRAQDEGARGAFDWQLYYKRKISYFKTN